MIKFYKDTYGKKRNFEDDEITRIFIRAVRDTFSFKEKTGKYKYILTDEEEREIVSYVHLDKQKIVFFVKENTKQEIKEFINKYIEFSKNTYKIEYRLDDFIEYLKNTNCTAEKNCEKERVLSAIELSTEQEKIDAFTKLVRYWLGYTYSHVSCYPEILRINEVSEIVSGMESYFDVNRNSMGTMMNHNQRLKFSDLLSGKYDIPRNLFLMLCVFFDRPLKQVADMLSVSGYNGLNEFFSWDTFIKKLCMLGDEYEQKIAEINNYLYVENLGKYTPIHSMINEIESIYDSEMKGVS